MSEDIVVYNLESDGTAVDTSEEDSIYYDSSSSSTSSTSSSSSAATGTGSAATSMTEGDVRTWIHQELSSFTGDVRIGSVISGQVFIIDQSGMRMGATNFSDAPFSVDYNGNLVASSATITGSVTATSGSFGGWVITSGYFYNLQSGTPTSSPNDGVVFASGNEAMIVYEDTAKRLEVGYLSAGIYGLKVYATDGVTVVYEVSDAQTVIAGWNFDDTYFYKLSSGTPTSSPNNGIVMASGSTPSLTVYEGTSKRVQMGYLSASVFGLLGYATNGTTKVFELSDTQQMIAGWIFTDSTFTSASSSIILDAVNQRISVGSGTPNILIDGAATTIGTSTFVSGQAGWRIDGDGSGEFNNIIARGEFRTAVFVKDEVHATGGTMIVLSASTLYANLTTVTSPSTSSMDITDPPSGHAQLFSVNDIVRIKDGSGLDNWLKVTAVSDQTTFYRYTVDKQSGTNGTFYTGTAVVDYKQSTDGFVLLTSDLSNAPYIDVGVSGTTPWSGTTAKARLGKLSGITDPTFGTLSGYGLWTDTGYFTGSVSSANGFIGGWTITSGFLYSLVSGTPSSVPNDGVVLRSGSTSALIVYEDTEKRVEVGYLSAGVYGIKGYATNGSTTLFEISDTQAIIAGWTISETTLANSTNIILDSSNKSISINNSTFGSSGIQMQYNSGTPRMYVGDGSKNFLSWSGSTLETSGSILPQLSATAGETLAVGDFVALRMGEVVKQVASDDTVVKENDASSNFGTGTTAIVGTLNSTGTGDAYFFVKWDLSTIAITTAEKVFVRIGFISTIGGSNGNDYEIRCYQVTGADWSESTLTWNNQPAFSATVLDQYQTSSSDAFTDDFLEESAGSAYLFLDITTLYNSWKSGTSNYGIVIRLVGRTSGTEPTTLTRNIEIATSENATAALRPTLIVSGVSDNVNKFYKANSTNFTDLVGPSGFVSIGGSSGSTVLIQREGIVSGLTGLTQGKTHYVTDSETLSTTPGTLIRDVGYALSTTSLYLRDQPRHLFTDVITYTQGNGGSNPCSATNTYFIPCGFKPKVIRFIGTTKNKSTIRAGSGIYQNGVQMTDTDDTITTGYIIYYSASGVEVSLSVTTVYETGVLITVVLQDNSSAATASTNRIQGTISFEA